MRIRIQTTMMSRFVILGRNVGEQIAERKKEILTIIIRQTRYRRDFRLLPRTNAHGQHHQSASATEVTPSSYSSLLVFLLLPLLSQRFESLANRKEKEENTPYFLNVAMPFFIHYSFVYFLSCNARIVVNRATINLTKYSPYSSSQSVYKGKINR